MMNHLLNGEPKSPSAKARPVRKEDPISSRYSCLSTFSKSFGTIIAFLGLYKKTWMATPTRYTPCIHTYTYHISYIIYHISCLISVIYVYIIYNKEIVYKYMLLLFIIYCHIYIDNHRYIDMSPKKPWHLPRRPAPTKPCWQSLGPAENLEPQAVTGWWLRSWATPLKNIKKVSWDDDIPIFVKWKKVQMFQTTNQLTCVKCVCVDIWV